MDVKSKTAGLECTFPQESVMKLSSYPYKKAAASYWLPCWSSAAPLLVLTFNSDSSFSVPARLLIRKKNVLQRQY